MLGAVQPSPWSYLGRMDSALRNQSATSFAVSMAACPRPGSAVVSQAWGHHRLQPSSSVRAATGDAWQSALAGAGLRGRPGAAPT